MGEAIEIAKAIDGLSSTIGWSVFWLIIFGFIRIKVVRIKE